MSVRQALARGFLGAVRAWRLVALSWAVNLGLASVLAWPAWKGLDGALARAPEGDRLLAGLDFALLAELLRDHADAVAAWSHAAAGLVVLALLLNALLAGGTLEVLIEPSPALLESFGRGASRHLGRFVRLALGALLGFGVCAGAVAMVLGALRRRFEDSPWEPMPLALGAGAVLALLALGVVWLLALDLARVEVASARGAAVRAPLRRALRRVLGSAAPSGIWTCYAVASLAVVTGYLALRSTAPASSWAGIAALLLLQQAFLCIRAALRLSLLGSLVALQQQPQPAALSGTK